MDRITVKRVVFSTYVEVIPGEANFGKVTGCILHVCGGDPNLLGINFIS